MTDLTLATTAIRAEIKRLAAECATNEAYRNDPYYAGQIQAYYNVLKTLNPREADYNLGVTLLGR